VKQLNVDTHVIFTGERRDIPQILRATNIFVSLDITGNPGNTILAEAFASEVPAIITKIPHDSPWHKRAPFEHLREAYLIPIKDKKSLVEGVVFLYKHREIAQDLVKHGKLWLLKHNRVSRNAIPYLINIYHSLIEK